MNFSAPPPLPRKRRVPLDRSSKVLTGLALAVAVFVGTVMVLRIAGMVRPFSVPTSAMNPAISPGDHVMVQGMSYLKHNPRRGDIMVFKTDGIAALPPNQIYAKRV